MLLEKKICNLHTDVENYEISGLKMIARITQMII